MGKSKKKNKKSEFDDFFEHTKIAPEGGWLTGVSAAAMDTDEQGPGTAPGPSAGPTSSAPSRAAPMALDTVITKSEPNLGVKSKDMKQRRGNRTVNQRKRKLAKLEKGMAQADKTVARLGKQVQTKNRKISFKTIY